ncbi:TctA family transporter [Tistlia consotensis]|uniref:TctA family transporter n=1 Tax=Tistlia consotensis USBA 355 TaxID=560819 RepID=A0A1Y6BJX8_9PROT|nr:tripartite tricarboxylate transporter permease [Tistlia consotensis]SMF13996.1 TctA family transporter [Tistlia consotensis USBA 355]SNR49982.1 TctA family transporter [Tistlia consotensis]
MHAIDLAFGLILDPYVLMVMIMAGLFGLFMGAIPGLSATMATALLVPVTFFMDPVPALAAIVTATAMAIFAGDIPGALLRIPGTPASAAYVDEAHAMTRRGKAELALGVSLSSAIIGGLFGSAVLASSAPVLADIALNFSSFEYFWLACMGLTCAAFVASDEPLKGFVSLLLGLFIATIGIDPMSGFPRFTFGNVDLMGGINFIPAMIGMFALAEVIRSVTTVNPQPKAPQERIGNVFKGLGPVLGRYKLNLLRGSVIGTLVGALPGAGSDIAAWISYAVSKKFSREKEKFGTGHPEGIVDAGSSNNAGLGGAWVPALVFGIPGDSITAIVIGVLYMKGMNPGPTVFLYHPELIYAVFLSFFLANLLLFPLGLLAIKSSKQLLHVPRGVLMPLILMFCIVGTFAINNTVFDVGVMLVLGLIAYMMEENGFPVAPAILGLVLGPLLEDSFMTSMIKSDGNLLAFFERPIAAGLGVVTLLIWIAPLFIHLRRRYASPAGDV